MVVRTTTRANRKNMIIDTECSEMIARASTSAVGLSIVSDPMKAMMWSRMLSEKCSTCCRISG